LSLLQTSRNDPAAFGLKPIDLARVGGERRTRTSSVPDVHRGGAPAMDGQCYDYRDG